MRRIFLLIFCLLIFVIPCAAEEDHGSSGSVSVSYGDSFSYQPPISDSVPPPFTIYTTYFLHRFTSAKNLNRIVFKDTWHSTLGYTKNDVVPFTATVDGIFYGSGLIEIAEQLDGDIWFDVDFINVNESYAYSLSGVEVVSLSYNNSVWDGVVQDSFTTMYKGTNGATLLTESKPTALVIYQSGGIYTTFSRLDSRSANTVFISYSVFLENDYIYNFNSTYNLSTVVIDKGSSSSKWSIYDADDTLYFEDDDYSLVGIDQTFKRYFGVYANITFDVAGGMSSYSVLDFNGTVVDSEDEDEGDFEYNITTELDEYSPGDTVNVTYTTDQKGTIQVVKTISGDIYHSIGFVSGATNATWQFYIAGNEPYGFYDVYLLDSSSSILDSVRYSLLPTTSSLDILQSSVDLHETFVVFAQTVNESILSIEDPDGVEVWNESIGALMYDYIYYTPTIKQGVYTAYLYDDATLNDTVMVYLADPPIIDDPLDPETNGTIPIEDVLEDDETMTEYFDDKFREFAPIAWSIFLLAVVLWLMAILSSFGGSGKRR